MEVQRREKVNRQTKEKGEIAEGREGSLDLE